MHISGAENEWADLLSRWAASTTYTIRRLVVIPPLSSTANDDFVWPSPDEIRLIQETHKPSKMDVLSLDNGLWKLKSGQVWIPDDESDLQLRLFVIAHTCAAGHRVICPTTSALLRNIHWSTIISYVKLFVRS